MMNKHKSLDIIGVFAAITLIVLMLPRNLFVSAENKNKISNTVPVITVSSSDIPSYSQMVVIDSTTEINSDAIYWNKLGELGVVWNDDDTPLFYITPSVLSKGGSSVYHLVCTTSDYGSVLTDENGESWTVSDAPEYPDNTVVYVTFDSKGTPELSDDEILNIAPCND